MIYLFYGSDTEKAQEKARFTVDALRVKKPDAAFLKIDAESFGTSYMSQYVGGQGLFEKKTIIFFDRILEKVESTEDLFKLLPELKESENICVFLEKTLTKTNLGKFEKVSEKIQVFEKKKTEEKVKKFEIFSLTDALARRDKKQLWVLYQKACDGGAVSEEICGILFWQVKSIIVAIESKTAGQSGLNPYVFSKAKSAGKNYTIDELKKLSSELINLYHNAHRGLVDFEMGLERWILGV